MKDKKNAVLLLNVGSPDHPDIRSVRRFLMKFLNDRRVIDIPWLLQKILVNLIIVPFRAPKSTRLYKRLWRESGSPLIVYSEKAKEKLQKLLPDNFAVFNAMRYGNPGYKAALNEIKTERYSQITVFPMFPQYASSTTGTIVQAIVNEIKNWYSIPDIRIVGQFYRNKGFIDAFVQRAHENKYQEYDHIVFSYHGLPLRQIDKSHPGINNQQCNCSINMPAHGEFCYKATCFETSRLLAKELGLLPDKYTVAFQSRLSNDWLEPFTDKTIEELAQKGKKSVLVVAPAFVADCLETIDEIGVEYKKLFMENGGKKLTLAESLNDMDKWVETLANMVLNA
jgi:protoporphyrin/coproporphyrin ferrochelatase